MALNSALSPGLYALLSVKISPSSSSLDDSGLSKRLRESYEKAGVNLLVAKSQ